MKTNKKELLDSFKGGLIVSCQVQHDDPTFSVDFVVKMAKAAQWGGAVGIRANDPEQIKAIKKEVDLPVIGLWKIWHDDTSVYGCTAIFNHGPKRVDISVCLFVGQSPGLEIGY